MIKIDDVLVSDDVAEKFFVCNLSKCKGACCLEGDLGAPLLESELPILAAVYPEVKPYLTKRSQEVIEKEGLYIIDWEDDFSTTTVDNKECAFAIYDENKILKCGIEQAYLDGKTNFRKPISCHLYPIRAAQYGEHTVLNYNRWDICSDACILGEELAVPVYKFLKEPLIRFLGAEWYQKLSHQIENQFED